MKSFKLLLFFMLAIGTFSLATPTTEAQTFNPDNQLHFYGRVLDTHHVVVDQQGKIIQIVSNTTQDVVPKVYVDRISLETQTELTEQVNEQYQKLVPKGSSRAGTLYEYKPDPKPSAVTKTRYSFLTNIFSATL